MNIEFILIVWSLIGCLWFFCEHWEDDEPIGDFHWTLWRDIIISGPLVWILVGAYLMGKG